LGLLRVAGRLGHEFMPSSPPARLPRASLNWKETLNEVAAGAGIAVPEYYVVESGPDYAKSFHASVRMSGRTYGEAEDRSSAEAQQGAAEAAWTSVTESAKGARRHWRPHRQ
jgi:ribonuclease III